MYKEHVERYFGPEIPCPAIRAIGYSKQKRTRPGLAPHHHDCFEISMIQKGTVHWFAKANDFTLAAGSALVTAPGDLHGCRNGVFEPCQLAWMQLEPTHMNKRGFQKALKEIAGKPMSGSAPLAQEHQALLEECRQPRSDSLALMHSLLDVFLQRLIRIARDGQETNLIPAALQKVIAAINKNPEQLWHINDLADIAGLGRSRLHQLCTHHLGESPASFALHQRLHVAQHLLRDSNDSITDIAFTLHFSSSQHFATAFKRRFGMSPREYRSQTEY